LILPDPSCSFGYPLGQVQELLGGRDAMSEFWLWVQRGDHWRVGQWCIGGECAAAHGPVIYHAYLAGYLEQAAA
jgi:hypothetical protein